MQITSVAILTGEANLNSKCFLVAKDQTFSRVTNFQLSWQEQTPRLMTHDSCLARQFHFATTNPIPARGFNKTYPPLTVIVTAGTFDRLPKIRFRVTVYS